MTKFKNQFIGIVGFSISVILIALFSTINLKLTDFVEKYISQDNQLELDGAYIKIYLFLIILIILVLSICSFFNLHRKLLDFISNFIDWRGFKKFLLTDDLCGKKQTPSYLLFISVIAGLLSYSFLLVFGEPEQEEVLEKVSSFLFFISGLVLMTSITQINKNQFPPKTKKYVGSTLIVISLLFFFIFGEEISWGQRIFNWESFGVFKEYNYQQEINTHNFLSPLFLFLYPIVGLGTFFALFLVWLFPNSKSYLFHLFIPPSSLFFIVFLMACSSFRGQSETYEELLAIFLLLYSIRIFICLRFPNKSNKFNFL